MFDVTKKLSTIEMLELCTIFPLCKMQSTHSNSAVFSLAVRYSFIYTETIENHMAINSILGISNVHYIVYSWLRIPFNDVFGWMTYLNLYLQKLIWCDLSIHLSV